MTVGKGSPQDLLQQITSGDSGGANVLSQKGAGNGCLSFSFASDSEVW